MDEEQPIRGRVCPRCLEPADEASLQGYCATHHAVWQRDRWAAVAWARRVLRASNVVLLDTETTGLDQTAEVVEIALLTPRGEMLFDSLMRPVGLIPAAATTIHHLDDAAVAHAPTWGELYPRIARLLHRRFVVVYNAAYDRRILEQTCSRAGVPSLRPAGWHCTMLEYARFTGVWNVSKNDYRWHKLQDGDHTALGDCRATLATIAWMAEAE
ncbi:MAG: 3'-5' exonuclease [Chloroflexota bacterium]|nr:3'-5' exonuclease [Chloroflexota bacterium]